MGLKYTFFRIGYEIKKKIGVFAIKFPTKPLSERNIYVNNWKETRSFNGVFSTLNDMDFLKKEQSILGKLLDGNRHHFNWQWFGPNELNDWVTNPLTEKKYPMIHWSKINQMDPEIGDIKYVWERSKFFHFQIYVNSITKYNINDILTNGLNEMLDWIRSNPRNIGPNWCCSQEISLRLINWTIFIQKFKKILLENFEKELAIVLRSIEEQIIHVHKNINFSKIAVRNNHAFSECLGLFIIYTVFPFFDNAKKRAVFGYKNFINEVEFQIFSDGSDNQYSTNYFRNKLQLITLFIASSIDFKYEIPQVVVERATESLKFFYSVISSLNDVPNLGLNDGSLPFRFDENVLFRNYRHQIDTLSLALNNTLKSSGNDYEIFFKGIKNDLVPISKEPLKKTGLIEYRGAGYIVINEGAINLLVRAGNYNSRPGQSDNMHVDLWFKGCNLLCDSGSYSYNTSNKDMTSYFLSTKSNNTVTVNDSDHMEKGANFIWTSIVEYHEINCQTIAGDYKINIVMEAYKYYPKPLMLQRTIILSVANNELIVEDRILNADENQHLQLKQHWHSPIDCKDKIKINSNADLVKNKGHVSLFYGKLDPVIRFDCVSSNNTVKTSFRF